MQISEILVIAEGLSTSEPILGSAHEDDVRRSNVPIFPYFCAHDLAVFGRQADSPGFRTDNEANLFAVVETFLYEWFTGASITYAFRRPPPTSS